MQNTTTKHIRNKKNCADKKHPIVHNNTSQHNKNNENEEDESEQRAMHTQKQTKQTKCSGQDFHTNTTFVNAVVCGFSLIFFALTP